MKKSATQKAVKAKAPKVRDVSVSFDEFIALRGINSGYYSAKPAMAGRLARKNLVEVTESTETVLARETKSAIFYKKVVKRNASLTPSGLRLLEKLNASL
jgi:hypothetical protein